MASCKRKKFPKVKTYCKKKKKCGGPTCCYECWMILNKSTCDYLKKMGVKTCGKPRKGVCSKSSKRKCKSACVPMYGPLPACPPLCPPACPPACPLPPCPPTMYNPQCMPLCPPMKNAFRKNRKNKASCSKKRKKANAPNVLKTCDSGTQYFCKERTAMAGGDGIRRRPVGRSCEGREAPPLRFACSADNCETCDSGRGHVVNEGSIPPGKLFQTAGKPCDKAPPREQCKQKDCDVCSAMRNLNMSNYNSGEDDYSNRQGQMVSGGRSYLRISIIPEIFWGIINFIAMFGHKYCYRFTSMFNPGMNSRGDNYATDYRVAGYVNRCR